MAIAADHKALLFIGAVAVLGAGVRVVRSVNQRADGPIDQSALERQMQSADSAAKVGRGGGGGGRRGRKARSTASDSVSPRPSPLPCILGKLDDDVATAAQIEALPGIGPATAKRIVDDRAEHGPFVSLTGFSRVRGITKRVRQQLESLVTFSGALRPLNAVPESVSTRSARLRGSKNQDRLCTK